MMTYAKLDGRPLFTDELDFVLKKGDIFQFEGQAVGRYISKPILLKVESCYYELSYGDQSLYVTFVPHIEEGT